jgi:hypothetical protein
VEIQMFQLYRDALEDLLRDPTSKKLPGEDKDIKKVPPLKITLAEHSPTGLVFVEGAAVIGLSPAAGWGSMVIPSLVVSTTLMSLIALGATWSGSRSRITRTANLPTSSVPLFSCSPYCSAAQAVIAFKPS